MIKRALSILAAFGATLIIALWLSPPHEQPKKKLSQPDKSAVTHQQQPKAPTVEPKPEARERSETNAETTPSLEIVQVAAPSSAKGKAEQPAYRVVGNGGYPAKVLDSQGNVVIEATPNFGIHGSSVSPNGERILVLGYPTSLVVEPATNRRIALPSQPPGKDKLGFASWRWIDNDTLVGESGDELTDRKAGAEGEGNNVAQTRLYLYSVSRQALEEVQLPKELGAKVFAVTEVSPDGYVHLVHDDPNAKRPPDLGWFKVRGRVSR